MLFVIPKVKKMLFFFKNIPYEEFIVQLFKKDEYVNYNLLSYM